ncbi:glycosyl hydrolases 36 [Baffinella frigidus]|nr:glycosyl hydrolases 36 [Cryptophyta sp. CCMP2293]
MCLKVETQFLLLELASPAAPGHGGETTEASDGGKKTVAADEDDAGSPCFAVILPLVSGAFRASLKSSENGDDLVLLCVESGDSAVRATCVENAVFVAAGSDPFQLLERSFQAVADRLQTFRVRTAKEAPPTLDCFGWCTWDAFYSEVDGAGILAGVRSLREVGTPARTLIIDDGWQDATLPEQTVTTGSGLRRGCSPSCASSTARSTSSNFSERLLGKADRRADPRVAGWQDLGVRSVYCWHTLSGYWSGGPRGALASAREGHVWHPKPFPGVLQVDPGVAWHPLTLNEVQLPPVEQAGEMFEKVHAFLASSGVDGVKVDGQATLTMLGSDAGGSAALTRGFVHALEGSVEKHFGGAQCINCMCHPLECFYSYQTTSVARASDDFWPRDPASHTLHIANVAYTSVFLAEIVTLDWDMFQSKHPSAMLHAVARAVGGCAVYVSDNPGNHNPEVLKRLVLPDGSVYRGLLPGRPTRDCLFVDPTRDGTSALKIWNRNRHTGLLAAFNLQSSSWDPVHRRSRLLQGRVPAVVALLRSGGWGFGFEVGNHARLRCFEAASLP